VTTSSNKACHRQIYKSWAITTHETQITPTLEYLGHIRYDVDRPSSKNGHRFCFAFGKSEDPNLVQRKVAVANDFRDIPQFLQPNTRTLSFFVSFLYFISRWSSGQSSWLQTQSSGFDFQRYHIFWELEGLERDQFSLLNTNKELIARKSSGSSLKPRIQP
jgi:hypothetical protein